MLKTSLLTYVVSLCWLMVNLCHGTCVQHSGNQTDQLLGEYINICQRLGTFLCTMLPGIYPFPMSTYQFQCGLIDGNDDGTNDACGATNDTRLDVKVAFVVDMANADTQDLAIQVLSDYYHYIWSVITNHARIEVEYIFIGAPLQEESLIYVTDGAENFANLTEEEQESLIGEETNLCSGLRFAVADLLQKVDDRDDVSANIILLNFSPVRDNLRCQNAVTFQETGIRVYTINFFEENDLGLIETTLGEFDQCTGVVTTEASQSGVTFDGIDQDVKTDILAQMDSTIADFLALHGLTASVPGTRSPTPSPSISTAKPSQQPSYQPSQQPSYQPSHQPSHYPSYHPSYRPSRQPSQHPSHQPSQHPSNQPSNHPSNFPSKQPSKKPSNHPSNQPSKHPSQQPFRSTSRPTNQPTNALPSSSQIVRVPPKHIRYDSSSSDSSSSDSSDSSDSSEFYNHRDSADN